MLNNARDLTPIVVVIGFFQLAVLQQPLPNIVELLVGLVLVLAGLTLATQRDVLLLLVEEHRARSILESIGEAGEFDESPGTGIAFQIDVEDAIGVAHQAAVIAPTLQEADK